MSSMRVSYHVFIFNAIAPIKGAFFSKNVFLLSWILGFPSPKPKSRYGKIPLKTGREGAMITKHEIGGKPGKIP